MILHLREFQEYPAQTRLRADSGHFMPFADSVLSVDEVTLRLAIQRSGDEFYCQGDIFAAYTVECARCLDLFDQRITTTTDFVVSGEDQIAARKKEALDDEVYVSLQGNDMCADVSEPVRQALILSLSLMPLCSEDCRGLCPRCGQNLNRRTCDCKTEDIDPRWQGLKGLAGRDL